MLMYVHTEEKLDPDVHEGDPGAAIGAVLELGESEHVLLEGSEEPLDPTATLQAAGIEDRAHLFLGKRHRILVTVQYNAQTHSREFSAAATVERVFHWAVGKHAFDLDPADAAEHTLALPDGSIPPEDAHIGSLPEPQEGQLALSLVPKHRFEG